MKYASLKETAEYFGVSYGIIRQMCVEGKIPHIRFGKMYRINLEEAETVLLKREADKIESRRPYRYYPKGGFLEALKNIK